MEHRGQPCLGYTHSHHVVRLARRKGCCCHGFSVGSSVATRENAIHVSQLMRVHASVHLFVRRRGSPPEPTGRADRAHQDLLRHRGRARAPRRHGRPVPGREVPSPTVPATENHEGAGAPVGMRGNSWSGPERPGMSWIPAACFTHGAASACRSLSASVVSLLRTMLVPRCACAMSG